MIGVKVDAQSSKRTVRIKLIFEGNQSLTMEMPLPTATRLTDELIDAEFMERFPGVGLLPRDTRLEDSPSQVAVAEAQIAQSGTD